MKRDNYRTNPFFIITGLTLLLFPANLMATHKCPGPPGGATAITSSPIYLPSATTAATAVSSNTSGCEKGHPSVNFYTPSVSHLYLFDMWHHVEEESSRGKGIHLDTLAYLLGCNKDGVPRFRTQMQTHYQDFFVSSAYFSMKQNTDTVLKGIRNFIEQDPQLTTECTSQAL